MDNVLIFTKYYTYFHQCRLRSAAKDLNNPISELSDKEKYKLYHEIFAYPDLVDMNTLFGYLINKLGSGTVIDPTTKEDALWRVIDFFTKNNICELSSYAENNFNTLNEADVAQYFKNHFEDSK